MALLISYSYLRDDILFTFVPDQDVQENPFMSPISSQELFSVLDEASEKTFLCAGTALSLQKYVFDGEAVKKALEIKNIVACTSFLIEIELVGYPCLPITSLIIFEFMKLQLVIFLMQLIG